MAGAQENIKARVAGKKVVLIFKPSCPYCAMAKKVFKEYLGNGLQNSEYDLWDISKESNCEQLQKALLKMTGARSVPRVFIKGKCIGGGNETQELHKRGKLREMLS